jgi:hypothetical protein
MSTEIKTIKGSYHKHVSASYKVTHEDAELYLTRFFNGKNRGTNIQLTIQGGDGISYIHLTQKQCEQLSKVLLECFDYDKYPSK